MAILPFKKTLVEWFRNAQDGPFSGSRLRSLPYPVVAIPLLIAHLALSQLGWTLLSGKTLTPVWPSSGLDMVALLAFGPRFWPVLLLGYFLTTSGRSEIGRASCKERV